MDTSIGVQLTTTDASQFRVQNRAETMTMSDAVRIYDTASQNQSNVKSLGSIVLKDASRFVSSLSVQNRPNANQGADKSENIFSSDPAGSSQPGKVADSKLDLQLERLKQTSDYAGFMAASVSLVSSAVASIKTLQQG
jgi:hypothetical protein